MQLVKAEFGLLALVLSALGTTEAKQLCTAVQGHPKNHHLYAEPGELRPEVSRARAGCQLFESRLSNRDFESRQSRRLKSN
jgi:hypothetical protein